MHNARWMAKAIYSLKVFLFRNQLKLTPHEAAGVTSVSTFVSLIYARYWHEAPLAEHAPVNDMKLLSQLHDYPQKTIRDAAISAFSRHLWYISEHLVTLALFDDRLDEATKVAMVKNFSRPFDENTVHRRIEKKTFNHLTPLEDYVTKRSLKLFNLLSLNGEEEAKVFLAMHPSEWSRDTTFQSFKAKVRLLKVVNDCAERGVALIQAFNGVLTKDETQKQYLLQLVSRHRKDFPEPTKRALKTK